MRPLRNRPVRRDSADRHLWEFQPARDVLWALGLGLLLVGGYTVRSVLGPVLMALILAYLFDPFITWARERARLPRALTSSVLALLMASIIVVLMAWGAPLLAKQFGTLTENLPGYLDRLSGQPGPAGSLAAPLASAAEQVQKDPVAALEPMVGGTTPVDTVGKVLGKAALFVMNLLLVPLYFLFFAWRFDRLSAAVWRVIPLARYPRLAVVAGRMDQAFNGFFRGRLVIAVIAAVLYALAWGLTGVPYWGLLAIGNGLLTFIPYASLAGWPLAVLFKYLDAVAAGPVNWMAVALWPSVAYLLVQTLEAWVLTPLIQSQASDMNPATVLLVVFIGGAMGGFFGLLLAVPVWACLWILFEVYVLPRLLDEANTS